MCCLFIVWNPHLKKNDLHLGKSQATAAVWFMAAWKLCSAWLRRCSESRLRAGTDDISSNMAWENHGKTWRNILQLEVSMGKPTIKGHWNGKMVIQLINDDWLSWVDLIDWLLDCWLIGWLIDWLVGWLIDWLWNRDIYPRKMGVTNEKWWYGWSIISFNGDCMGI